ncbi:sulfate adenylyltransferase [Escherichia coli]
MRFRTLGCYPLTGAIESDATTLPEIMNEEMLLTTSSERQGRLIDHDPAGSMEQKKRQGYFYRSHHEQSYSDRHQRTGH